MARRRDRESSSSSDTSSSPSEGSSDDQGGEDQQDEVVASDKTLETFYAEQPRVDSRTPTLQLAKSSIDFYFGTVLKEGEMSKEGKKIMTEKYFLEPEAFKRVQPPELKDTSGQQPLGEQTCLASLAVHAVFCRSRAYDKRKRRRCN